VADTGAKLTSVDEHDGPPPTRYETSAMPLFAQPDLNIKGLDAEANSRGKAGWCIASSFEYSGWVYRTWATWVGGAS